jgi:thiol-disulfide isomerase/thioredoxin
LLTGKQYSTDQINKYILFDFWGTWCQPCLASTDELKKINDRYKNASFQLISIAKDKSKSEVKKYLKNQDINWINFFDGWDNPDISNKFKVIAYPTFILINQDGKIIARVTGADQLSVIENILSKELAQ